MDRSSGVHEVYRAVMFTLQGIIQATVFTFTAERFLGYVVRAHGAADVAFAKKLGVVLSDIVVVNYAIVLVLSLIVLSEYICYSAVIGRIPKVIDLSIVLSMGLLQTWMAMSAESGAQFWFFSAIFFVPVFLIYYTTSKMPMLEIKNRNNERETLFRMHLLNQTFVAAGAFIWSIMIYCSFDGLNDLHFFDASYLYAATVAYGTVFGGFMIFQTGNFIKDWFSDNENTEA
jgi:hypothetical protein